MTEIMFCVFMWQVIKWSAIIAGLIGECYILRRMWR